jgi:integrase
MRSFLGYVLKRPPNTKRIKIGQRPEPKAIIEPSKDEIIKLMAEIDKQPLTAKAALHVLIETGHRRNAIMRLPRNAVQMRETGPIIEYPPSIEKKKTSSVCPITRATYGLLVQLLATHKDPYLFPCSAGVWDSRGHWLYRTLRQVVRETGIITRIYPHLFRHIKALELRRSNAETDTVCNLLGWRDPTVYNVRYGRIPAYETCEEARGLLKESDQIPQKQPQGPQRKTSVELIGELAQMLKVGIIDLPTYQASLTMINQGIGTEIKKPEPPGYG